MLLVASQLLVIDVISEISRDRRTSTATEDGFVAAHFALSLLDTASLTHRTQPHFWGGRCNVRGMQPR
eukprot:6650974-Pyramimonas_sp.AAC.1